MKFKRLELRLPEDHEIFSYPSGTRSTMATVFLDIGIKLSRIDERLDYLEQCIAGLKDSSIKTPSRTKSDLEGKRKMARNIMQVFDID